MHIWIHHILHLIWNLVSLGILYKIAYAKPQQHLPAKIGSALVGSGTALFILNLFSAFTYPGDNFGLLCTLTWTTFLHIPLFLAVVDLAKRVFVVALTRVVVAVVLELAVDEKVDEGAVTYNMAHVLMKTPSQFVFDKRIIRVVVPTAERDRPIATSW